MSITNLVHGRRCTYLVGTVITGIAVLGVAACGSDQAATSNSSAAGPGVPAANTTVLVSNGMLTTAAGQALYRSDQESAMVRCTSEACTAVWAPLTVPKGQEPTGPSPVEAMLRTVRRPDGTSQVTFGGAPLYTFSFDHGAGHVGGDGATDSFDGTDFTWHLARTGAGASSPAPSTSSSDGSGYGY